MVNLSGRDLYPSRRPTKERYNPESMAGTINPLGGNLHQSGGMSKTGKKVIRVLMTKVSRQNLPRLVHSPTRCSHYS